TYGAPDTMNSLIAQLQGSNRSNRIDELRSTDRFFITPSLLATFGGQPVKVDNLSARGAGIELPFEPVRGTSALLRFHVPQSEIAVQVNSQIVWTGLKSVNPDNARTYKAGLSIGEKPELMRL